MRRGPPVFHLLGILRANEWHGLIWTALTADSLPGLNVLRYNHGPWYWVWVAYCAADPARPVSLVITPYGEGSRAGGRVIALRSPATAGGESAPSRLIPVCSSCRRIRGADGTWQNFERYAKERWNAQFTHGLCRDCMTKPYPEVDPGAEP